MTGPETDTEAKPPIAAAVMVRGGRVLMVRRRISEGELSWQFPAGAVEPGETPGAAAARECREETGLAANAVKLLGRRTHPATGREMSYVLCEDVTSPDAAGEPWVADADELDAVAWAHRGELAKLVPQGLYAPVQAYLDTVLEP